MRSSIIFRQRVDLVFREENWYVRSSVQFSINTFVYLPTYYVGSIFDATSKYLLVRKSKTRESSNDFINILCTPTLIGLLLNGKSPSCRVLPIKYISIRSILFHFLENQSLESQQVVS